MKVKDIKIVIKNREQALNEFARTLAKARKGEKILPRREISFQNINAIRKVLTQRRMELMHAIKEYNPESIYELAKIVDRDLKSVNMDIKMLKSLDFVSLKKVNEERRKVKPKVEFEKINVEIVI